jgi:hypothetical protein
MPVAKREWAQASEQRNMVTSVYEILDEGSPRAYCIDDFFRNAGPGGPHEHGLLEAFKRAVLWQMSRRRSKAQVERALETLVSLGEVEKRSVPCDGEPVTHYRMKPTAERRF